MFRLTVTWPAALVLAAATPALAQAPTLAPVAATVGTAQQIDFTSAVNGKTYRITIAKPYAFPPKGGYPVVYVLDGGAYFGTFARLVDNASVLAARLTALKGAPGYKVESKIFAGQSHMSVPWEALNTMLNFAPGKGSQQP
ncbi:hypothetical protein [Phenylobacterium sp.]|jgi:hypothetical protein|uniref:hypothetical protein n=1 Tax=Phenylobacterium sp. TaxID=1871053 RepID=UPI0037C589BC